MLTILNKTGINVDVRTSGQDGSYQQSLKPDDSFTVEPDPSTTNVNVKVRNTSGTPFLINSSFGPSYYGDTLYVLTVDKGEGGDVVPLSRTKGGNHGYFVSCQGGEMQFEKRMSNQLENAIDEYDYSYALVCGTRGLSTENIRGWVPISCGYNLGFWAQSIVMFIIVILFVVFILLILIAAIVWLIRRT